MGQFDALKPLQSDAGAASKPAHTSHDGPDFSDYRNPFPNGLFIPRPSRSEELERRDFRVKSPDKPKPLSPGADSDFSLKVGGTDLPVGNGVDIWDPRSSILNEAGRNGDTRGAGDTANHNYGADFNQRYEPKKPSFGLTWHHKF